MLSNFSREWRRRCISNITLTRCFTTHQLMFKLQSCDLMALLKHGLYGSCQWKRTSVLCRHFSNAKVKYRLTVPFTSQHCYCQHAPLVSCVPIILCLTPNDIICAFDTSDAVFAFLCAKRAFGSGRTVWLPAPTMCQLLAFTSETMTLKAEEIYGVLARRQRVFTFYAFVPQRGADNFRDAHAATGSQGLLSNVI